MPVGAWIETADVCSACVSAAAGLTAMQEAAGFLLWAVEVVLMGISTLDIVFENSVGIGLALVAVTFSTVPWSTNKFSSVSFARCSDVV